MTDLGAITKEELLQRSEEQYKTYDYHLSKLTALSSCRHMESDA